MFLAKLSDRIWVSLCVAVGTVASFAGISRSSIWYDEAFTMMLIRLNPAEIWVRNMRDVHPPLHYLVMHYWVKLFGTSELAARSLSALFMIACIPLAYLLVKRLSNRQSARLAALFVATGPYIIRFAQEARMYAMVTFLLMLATFLLVRAIQDKRRIDWILYSVAMATALYTHYYTVFMVIVHWLYLLKVAKLPKQSWKRPWKLIFVNKSWFVAMVGMVILFLPWLPAALGQFSKVSAGFWIGGPPPDTLARTLIQFVTFNNLDVPPAELIQFGSLRINPISTLWHLAAYVLFLGAVWHHMRKDKQHQPGTLLLALYALVPSIIVFLLSLRRAIYLDRYFTFAAVSFYCLLAVIISAKKPPLRMALVVLLLTGFGWGAMNIRSTNYHRMRDVAGTIDAGYSEGDTIMAAELYSFFDLHYYITQYYKTGPEPKLLHSDDFIDGYGVTSLIYDRLDEVLVERYEDVKTTSGFVWVVAQESKPEFFEDVPSNWQPVGQRYHFGRHETQKYRVQ